MVLNIVHQSSAPLHLCCARWNMDEPKFGNYLKRLLKQIELNGGQERGSQEWLAHELCIDVSEVRRYTRGTRLPSNKRMQAIFAILTEHGVTQNDRKNLRIKYETSVFHRVLKIYGFSEEAVKNIANINEDHFDRMDTPFFWKPPIKVKPRKPIWCIVPVSWLQNINERLAPPSLSIGLARESWVSIAASLAIGGTVLMGGIALGPPSWSRATGQGTMTALRKWEPTQDTFFGSGSLPLESDFSPLSSGSVLLESDYPASGFGSDLP